MDEAENRFPTWLSATMESRRLSQACAISSRAQRGVRFDARWKRSLSDSAATSFHGRTSTAISIRATVRTRKIANATGVSVAADHAPRQVRTRSTLAADTTQVMRTPTEPWSIQEATVFLGRSRPCCQPA